MGPYSGLLQGNFLKDSPLRGAISISHLTRVRGGRELLLSAGVVSNSLHEGVNS